MVQERIPPTAVKRSQQIYQVHEEPKSQATGHGEGAPFHPDLSVIPHLPVRLLFYRLLHGIRMNNRKTLLQKNPQPPIRLQHFPVKSLHNPAESNRKDKQNRAGRQKFCHGI